MGSPAGFLNFQGHNALNGGHQYISMNFSNNINDSLAFEDSLNDFPYDALTSCDYKTSQDMIHNFTVWLCIFSSLKTVRVEAVRLHVIPMMGMSTQKPVFFRGLTTN